MRAWILYSALILNLSINPAAAQQPSATEGEAHILSAFTSRADPGVLAAGVEVGPALRSQLDGETDSRKIYDALVERTSGKPLRVNLLAPGEVVRYASLPGVQAGEPLIRLEAGELVYLFQYASKQKNVTFVEQLSKPAARTEAAKPPPIVEVPLPTAPPPPEPPPAPVATPAPTPPVPAAPAPAATPTPPAFVIEKPRPPAVAVQKPAPIRAEKPRPRGECVIKPVMSEDDLWNCSGPVRPAAVERPALPVEAPKPAAARTETPAPRGECVIKPVMSEEDLRNCAAVSTPRTTAAIERPPVAVDKPQPSAPAIEAPKPRPECVIKPVMSEEDLRNCAAVSTPRTAVAIERPVAVEKPQPSAPAVEAPKPRPECVIKPVMSEEDLRNCAAVSTPRTTPAVERPPVAVEKLQPSSATIETPKPRPDCVIKPVMSEEDLRNCAAASRPVALERPAPPVAVEKPQPPAPAAPQPKRECAIKPVMSEEDLRACGVRR